MATPKPTDPDEWHAWLRHSATMRVPCRNVAVRRTVQVIAGALLLAGDAAAQPAPTWKRRWAGSWDASLPG